jgi:hypothetical protein
MHKEFYQIAGKTDSRKIAAFLSKDDQLLLPLLELICNTEQAVDELIDVVGKADKGKKKLKQLAKWLEQGYPSASGSLLEGLDEMFTINRLSSAKDSSSLPGPVARPMLNGVSCTMCRPGT